MVLHRLREACVTVKDTFSPEPEERQQPSRIDGGRPAPGECCRDISLRRRVDDAAIRNPAGNRKLRGEYSDFFFGTVRQVLSES